MTVYDGESLFSDEHGGLRVERLKGVD